jgi:acyl-CoA hydrolase
VAGAIGQHVAALIDNGSTLQMGIGEIPDAVLLFLAGKRDLGIHTEMFSDGVVELFERGVITGEAQDPAPRQDRGLLRARLEAHLRLPGQQPVVEFHPTDYVNDPFVIAQNDRMVAINSALAVDLTGQVCADSIGCSIYSGFGGQLDFIAAPRARKAASRSSPSLRRRRRAASPASWTPWPRAPEWSPRARTCTTS